MNFTIEKGGGAMNLQERIEEHWKTRAIILGYKPGTAKYQKMQSEFFVGAISAICAADETATDGTLSKNVPVIWPLCIISGREVCQ